MYEITCCKGCEPPKRHREPSDCHMDCPEYLEQKKLHEEDKTARIQYDREHGFEADLYIKKSRQEKKIKREKR